MKGRFGRGRFLCSSSDLVVLEIIREHEGREIQLLNEVSFFFATLISVSLKGFLRKNQLGDDKS